MRYPSASDLDSAVPGTTEYVFAPQDAPLPADVFPWWWGGEDLVPGAITLRQLPHEVVIRVKRDDLTRDEWLAIRSHLESQAGLIGVTHVPPEGRRMRFRDRGTLPGDMDWDAHRERVMPDFRPRGKPSRSKPKGKHPISSRERKVLARWNGTAGAVAAAVSGTVDYARGEIPAQIEEKREILRMLKAGQYRKAVETFGYGAVQAAVRMLKWQVGTGLQVADELLLNPRDSYSYTLLIAHSSGKQGDLLGLPGTVELTFKRHYDRSLGRYEDKRITMARVGEAIRFERRYGGREDVMLLDDQGNELDPEPFIAVYDDVSHKYGPGWRYATVLQNPRYWGWEE